MFHPNLGQVKSLNFPKDEPFQILEFCQLWGRVRFRFTKENRVAGEFELPDVAALCLTELCSAPGTRAPFAFHSSHHCLLCSPSSGIPAFVSQHFITQRLLWEDRVGASP